MPKNRELIDFKLVETPGATALVESNWGSPEVTILLTGGARQMYDSYDGGNGYTWLYASREVVQNLHRATGEFLAKVASERA